MEAKIRGELLDIFANVEITATLINNFKNDNDPGQMGFYSEALHKDVKEALKVLGESETKFSERVDEVI